MTLLNKFVNAFNKAGKKTVFNYLQSLPVSQLKDYGYSPELLAEGLSAWPWREDNEVSEIANTQDMIIEEQRHINTLESYSDAELRDLGINRGVIQQSVRYGRPGIDNLTEDQAA